MKIVAKPKPLPPKKASKLKAPMKNARREKIAQLRSSYQTAGK